MTKQSHIFFFIAIFIAVFAAYLYTAYPSVSPYRDSGDLVAAGYTLGIAHPPGYPLYTLSGKITCTLALFANAGYRVNLMSIIFASLCAALAFLITKEIWDSSAAGIVTAACLALSPAFYSLAHVSEMYSMAAFFAALIFLILLKVKNHAYSCLLFLLFALSLGSHPAMSLLLPGILLFFLINRKEYGITLSFAFKLLLFFMLGFLIFAYFPVRAAANPVLQWGRTDTLEGFFRLITRADYGGLKLHPEQSKFEWTAGSIAAQALLYGKSLVQQFGIIGLLTGLLGIFVSAKKKIWWPAFTGLALAGPLFFILSSLPIGEKTTLPILEPHIVTPNLIFAIFIGSTAGWMSQLRINKALAAGIAAVIVVSAAFSAGKQSYRENFFTYDYGKNLFRTMAKDSLLYDPDDLTAFVISCFQLTSAARPDIIPLEFFRTRWGYERLKARHPEILPERDIPTSQELVVELFSYNIQKRDIYTDIITKMPGTYNVFPAGMLYKAKAVPDLKVSIFSNSEVLLDDIYVYRGRYDTSIYSDFFINRIIYYYAAARNNLGMVYAGGKAERQYQLSITMDPSMAETWSNLGALYYAENKYEKALEYFKKAIEVNPKDPLLFYNAGIVAKNTGRNDEALKYFEKSLKISYNPGSANEIGLIELGRGNYDRAAYLFNEIISKSPQFAAAYYNLGLALQKKGSYDAAIRAYSRYLDFTSDPKDIAETRAIIKNLEK